MTDVSLTPILAAILSLWFEWIPLVFWKTNSGSLSLALVSCLIANSSEDEFEGLEVKAEDTVDAEDTELMLDAVISSGVVTDLFTINCSGLGASSVLASGASSTGLFSPAPSSLPPQQFPMACNFQLLNTKSGFPYRANSNFDAFISKKFIFRKSSANTLHEYYGFTLLRSSCVSQFNTLHFMCWVYAFHFADSVSAVFSLLLLFSAIIGTSIYLSIGCN